MFKELVAVWKSRGIMLKVVETFGMMLDDCAVLFNLSWHVFTGDAPQDGSKEDVQERDAIINERERKIRRLLVEHLSVNPGQDASGCLALMSMVKDAERIGDYAKNIFDLAVMVDGDKAKLRHLDEMKGIQKRIAASLASLKPTFLESDQAAAREILTSYESVKSQCNAIVHAVFREELPKQEALITATLARYMKRVNSHAGNVASGVIYPLDQIDFIRSGMFE